MASLKRDIEIIPLTAETGRAPGWGCLDLSIAPEFLDPWQAVDAIGWTNRTGMASDNIGTLATRLGFADGPHYGCGGGINDTTETYDSVRMLAKYFPLSGADEGLTGGQVLALVQTEAGASKSIFKKWVGASWSTITGALGNSYYPQWIVLGLPSSKFCWVDLENGLHVYNGATDTAQAIPKWQGGGNITGALWLDQMDGRLIVSGNWVDAGESNIVYYTAANDTTKWTSANGGGSFPVYSVDSRSGMSAPKRVMGLAVLNGMLLVFSEDARYLVYGLGSASQGTSVFPGEGCFSGKCIIRSNDGYIYWWGKDGAYRWNGGEAECISDPIWNKVQYLKLLSAHKWFSYEYKDQWVTCVRYAPDPITFTGAGLDDMTNLVQYTADADVSYRIQIDGTGTPNTFKWSNDSGVTWQASTVAITGGYQTLNNGVKIKFAATTGHTATNRWDFTITAVGGFYPRNDYYHRWVYDLKLKRKYDQDAWYIDDIPMVAAFSSMTGITEIGRLYFASPIPNASGTYQTYCYGWDEVAQCTAYRDAITGTSVARVGTDIWSYWITPLWCGRNRSIQAQPRPLSIKRWEQFMLRLGTGSTGTFTSAALQYRTDDNTSWNTISIAGSTGDVWNHVYPTGDANGHYIQCRFKVVGSKQLIVKRLVGLFKDTTLVASDG